MYVPCPETKSPIYSILSITYKYIDWFLKVFDYDSLQEICNKAIRFSQYGKGACQVLHNKQ